MAVCAAGWQDAPTMVSLAPIDAAKASGIKDGKARKPALAECRNHRKIQHGGRARMESTPDITPPRRQSP
jgi:hypothetical protein